MQMSQRSLDIRVYHIFKLCIWTQYYQGVIYILVGGNWSSWTNILSPPIFRWYLRWNGHVIRIVLNNENRNPVNDTHSTKNYSHSSLEAKREEKHPESVPLKNYMTDSHFPWLHIISPSGVEQILLHSHSTNHNETGNWKANEVKPTLSSVKKSHMEQQGTGNIKVTMGWGKKKGKKKWEEF